MNYALVPKLGTELRGLLPDTTWQRVPDRMLRLLVEVERSDSHRRCLATATFVAGLTKARDSRGKSSPSD
jgi:hypothetical protein